MGSRAVAAFVVVAVLEIPAAFGVPRVSSDFGRCVDDAFVTPPEVEGDISEAGSTPIGFRGADLPFLLGAHIGGSSGLWGLSLYTAFQLPLSFLSALKWSFSALSFRWSETIRFLDGLWFDRLRLHRTIAVGFLWSPTLSVTGFEVTPRDVVCRRVFLSAFSEGASPSVGLASVFFNVADWLDPEDVSAFASRFVGSVGAFVVRIYTRSTTDATTAQSATQTTGLCKSGRWMSSSRSSCSISVSKRTLSSCLRHLLKTGIQILCGLGDSADC